MASYAALAELLSRRIGIRLRSDFEESLAPLVTARVRALGLAGLGQYLELLSSLPIGSEEMAGLVAAVANPHTFFFRDTDQLALLRKPLTARRPAARPLFIWSAGCATGEEPYSLAMLCADLGVEASILATDINRFSLEIAREACYRPWGLRHLPAGYRERFFEPEGECLRVAASVRQAVRLELHSLVEPPFPRPPRFVEAWDWILCRNVFIYFDAPVVARVCRDLAAVLGREGWLFLSSTETIHGLDTPLRAVTLEQSTGYRKEDAPALAASRVSSAPVRSEQPLRPAATGPVLSDSELYARATRLLDGDDPLAAQAALEEILARDPGHLLACITRGNVLLRRHNFGEALSAYRRAQDLAPLLSEVHYLQGLAYRKLGDWEQALQAFRRTLFLEPEMWRASFLLAGVYARLGRVEQQRRLVQHTLQLLEGQPPRPFRSHVRGIKDAELSEAEVAEGCRRLLHRPPGGASTGGLPEL